MEQQEQQRKPVVFKLQNQRKSTLSTEEALLRMCSTVAIHCPQYTLKQLYNEVPFREVQILYNAIIRGRAEELLYLNMVVNGPHEQNKSKRGYKNAIKQLEKDSKL